MSPKLTLSALAVLSMTACTTAQVEEAKRVLAGTGSNLGDTVSVTRNADGTLDITTPSGTATGLVEDNTFASRIADTKFKVYTNQAPGGNSRDANAVRFVLALYGKTDAVEAGLVGSVGDEDIDIGTVFKRLVDTELPTAGNAKYAGKYVGILSSGPEGGAQRPFGAVKGNVGLNVDFGAESVDGTITDRIFLDPAGDATATARDRIPPTLDDVVLNKTTLNANGTFVGTATGGSITDIDTVYNITSPAAGTYGGLLGGTNANEAVGGVLLSTTFELEVQPVQLQPAAAGKNAEQKTESGTFTEAGLFHADKQ